MRHHHHRIAAVSLGLALAMAGCSGEASPDPGPDGSQSVSAPSTPASTSGSPSPRSPKDLASAALTDYFAIASQAEKSGKLKDLARLSKVASGKALLDERQKVIDYADNGVRLRGSVSRTLGDVVTRDAGTFIISVCEDRSRSKVVVLSSGAEVPFVDQDGKPVPDRVTVEYTVVERTKRDWVVESLDVRSEQTC